MKARTKAQKLRSKRVQSGDMPELACIPKREKNGRQSRRGKSRSLDIETLKTRCIQMGKSITPANIREMRAQWWGCHAGRVIGQAIMSDNDRKDLWTAIVHMRKVIVAHDAALGVPRRHAVCLRLLAPVDEMHADAETPPADDRDDATKQRQATAALMTLEKWLGHTDSRAAGEAKRVVWQDVSCVDPEGLLLALRCVSDGIKGRKINYRGRKAIT